MSLLHSTFLPACLTPAGDGSLQCAAPQLRGDCAQADNVGHKLLSMMGWKEGEGLGAAGAGQPSAPVQLENE